MHQNNLLILFSMTFLKPDLSYIYIYCRLWLHLNISFPSTCCLPNALLPNITTGISTSALMVPLSSTRKNTRSAIFFQTDHCHWHIPHLITNGMANICLYLMQLLANDAVFKHMLTCKTGGRPFLKFLFVFCFQEWGGRTTLSKKQETQR